MCGRFALTISPKQLAELFSLDNVPDLPPQYNIAPGQNVAAVTSSDSLSRREFRWLLWGLVPHWAKEPTNAMINARSETAAAKPAFRKAFEQRRCLIPADGFFEWQKLDRGKQPWFIHRQDGHPIALAGLWDRWTGCDHTIIESCVILTTIANTLMKPIHDRMPVIIDTADFDLWLDGTVNDPARLSTLCKPFLEKELHIYPVSLFVNNPRNNSPQCLDPAAKSPQDPMLFDK